MNIKYLIIPDIHGRTFWRKPMEKFYDKVEHIIFLGDYFDPYPSEKITESDAIDNWHNIMSFIADNELWGRTTMLIGNHDAHYVSSIFAKFGGSSRKSKEYVDLALRIVGQIPECKDCPIECVCAGGCPASAENSHGSFYAKESKECQFRINMTEELIKNIDEIKTDKILFDEVDSSYIPTLNSYKGR